MTVYISRRACCDLCGATVFEDDKRFTGFPQPDPPHLPYDLIIHGLRYMLCEPCARPHIDAFWQQIRQMRDAGTLYNGKVGG